MNIKSKKLNIAVIGWFNYLNAGDDRVGEVLIKLFNNHNVSLIKNYNRELLKCFDLLIFTAGTWHPRNEISRDFQKWYSKIKIPYMALGLGVEYSVDEKVKKNYDYFVSNSLFTYVRDTDSAKALGNQATIIIGPDITWLYPFKEIKSYSPTNKIYANLRPYGKLKSEIDDLAVFLRHNMNIDMFYSLSPEDSKLAKKYNFTKIRNFDQRRIPEYCSLVVGMRFHSSIFCQQSTIPHYNLVYHQKVGSLENQQESILNTSPKLFNLKDFKDALHLFEPDNLVKEHEILKNSRILNTRNANQIKEQILSALESVEKNNYSSSMNFKIKQKLLTYF
jgi:hypothetical protein